jgi:hypothetical protein
VSGCRCSQNQRKRVPVVLCVCCVHVCVCVCVHDALCKQELSAAREFIELLPSKINNLHYRGVDME